MELIATPPAASQVKSPFQLLAAYSENDKDKFFGRDAETALLYQSVQEANSVLVYGESGTGKTSLVQCGLINETKHFNWTSITIRRMDDINRSLTERLMEHVEEGYRAVSGELGVIDLLQEVFLHSFQPILLIFDQFEELYIFGKDAERKLFLQNLEEIFKLRIPWKMIFVMREEFIARLTEFEEHLPQLFKKRMRVELMNNNNCREVITRSCERFNIALSPLRPPGSQDADIPEKVIAAVSNTEGKVHPPYLQVFLDTLWKQARSINPDLVTIDEAVVDKVGSIGNVLKAFLEEKVNDQQVMNKIDVWKFLKLFVPETGTSRKKVLLSEYTAIPLQKLRSLVAYLTDWKILSLYGEDNYELAHESLVPIIQNIKLTEIRARLARPTINGNPYKGLQSFDSNDNYRFYGRREAIQAVYDKVRQQNLVVIVGNSGAGKSSLIKAGLLPILEAEGYKILPIVRAGEHAQPVQRIEEALADTRLPVQPQLQFLLLIDQYEELITRINEKEIRQGVYEKLFALLENQRAGKDSFTLKIVITVRADFEPQFRTEAPLTEYWKMGKYLVPPFSRDEIREVIEEPAYQAGLEFSPPSLVDTITQEVYSSQATGLLPLMSFTLSELYKAYEDSHRNDGLLTEEDYYRLGGVIGGLQNRADQIFQSFESDHRNDYTRYQLMMQNIILRMVYMSTGELAGQRVLQEDLVFIHQDTDRIANDVMGMLTSSHLIVSGKDNQLRMYYEPAHDVLVKTWGQLWEWIGKMGKDAFFLRNRLSQAVHDFYSSNQDTKLLWDHNPWLVSLAPLLEERDTCWLNKREYEFVLLSRQKTEEEVALAEKDRVEKLRMIQDKVAEQKVTIRRIRLFRTIILTALVIAASLGVFAFMQYSSANKNYKKTLTQKSQIDNLAVDLQQRNRLLNGVILSKTQLADQEKRSAIKADSAARVADSQRQIADIQRRKALALVRQLNVQVIFTKAAQKLAESRRDSLDRVAADEKKARHATDSVNRVLSSRNAELDSANSALSVQKSQNINQLLTLSKKLEQEDLGKAYRLAELAHNRAPLNREVTEQFNRLSAAPAYYYVKTMAGTFSKFLPNGQRILLYNAATDSISLLESSTYQPLSAAHINPHLLSLSFSPDGKWVLLVYKNEIEIRNTASLNSREVGRVRENNISNAVFSASNRILVQAENGLHLWSRYTGSGQPEKLSSLAFDALGSKVISAVFSEDEKRVLCNCVNGGMYIWDPATGIVNGFSRTVSPSYISPNGEYFIVGTATETTLYNSRGERVKMPNFSRHGPLGAATFSADGRYMVLSFLNTSVKQQSFQQNKEAPYAKTDYIMVGLRDPHSDTVLLNTYLLPDYMTVSYNGVISRDNGLILTFEENSIVFDRQNGALELFNTADRRQKTLVASADKTPAAISLRDNGNLVLTSTTGNLTRVWKYETPGKLDKAGLLPTLTADDMKKYGVADM